MENIAVIGSGSWGLNLIRQFYNLGVLKRVADIGENNFSLIKNEFPGILLSQDYQDTLLDKDIKAVVIATPPVSHYELAKEALLAGRCVWVEKPMALNVKDAEELVKIAYSRSLIVMVGHILLYQPALIKLKSIVRSGQLGRIYYIYTKRLNFGKVRKFENALWSLAPHDISNVIYLLDKTPVEVSCAGMDCIQEKNEDFVYINLFFEDNVFANINVSWLDPLKDRKLVIAGSKRMAVLDEESFKDKLRIYNQYVKIPNEGKPKGEYYSLKKGKTIFPAYKDSSPLYEECSHFIYCLAKGKSPVSDGNQGLEVVKILSACEYSLKNKGKKVKLDEK